MYTKARAVLLAVFMAAGLVLAGAQPAAANQQLVIAFAGTATVENDEGGLGLNVPPDLDKQDARDFDWEFSSDTCVIVGETKKKAEGVGVDDNCEIEAEGEGIGYCGWSEGFGGEGTITTKWAIYHLENVGWDKALGGTLVVTGDIHKHEGDDENNPKTANGSFTIVVEAVPNPTGGSCALGDATLFNIAGSGEAHLENKQL